jgi:hypothetical protein
MHHVLLLENDVGEVGSSWAIIVTVPFIMLFLLIVVPFSVPDFNQDTVFSAMPWTMLLRWSDVARWVPTGTLSVVILVTPVFVLLVMDWIHYGFCVQHHPEMHMGIDFFVVFVQTRGDLINEHLWS